MLGQDGDIVRQFRQHSESYFPRRKQMNRKVENKEFIEVDAALKRAAKAAQALARKTKTPCYIWKDGAIVNVAAQRRGKKLGRISG
jgi:hypothetical protein